MKRKPRRKCKSNEFYHYNFPHWNDKWEIGQFRWDIQATRQERKQFFFSQKTLEMKEEKEALSIFLRAT